MNEGRNQTIGIILISIIVYLLAARFFQRFENTDNEIVNETVEVDPIQSPAEADQDLTNLVEETPPVVVIAENGDTLEIDAASYAAQNKWGAFYPYAAGTAEDIVIENDLLRVVLHSKGAQVKSVELKEFKDYSKEALMLIDETQTINCFLQVNSAEDKLIETKDIYFESSKTGNQVVFKAKTNDGEIRFTYALQENSYLLDYQIDIDGLTQELKATDFLDMNWDYVASKHEQDMSNEKTKSTAYWKVIDGDVEHLGIGKSKEEEIENSVDWISYKQRFFNVALIGNEGFTQVALSTDIESDDSTKVAGFASAMQIAFNDEGNASFQFFFGPNNYKLLKGFNNGLHHVVELSADFFLFRWVKWINAWLIIPLFNFLENYISNYGIIILIMTILIKMILMPLTFKSYVSSAKQRVLKPELEALKAQYGDDQAAYSRAQMELYQKTGVSMFGGCLPMLLQMPFLLAMFYFFPSSIELRQESFLWATDLSTFDTIPILTWAKSIPLLGNHLSVFTVLMTVSSILMAKFNTQMQAQPSQPGMEMMKYMPYIFPFFLLFLFNSFPAALTYYYFLSNMITFGQQFVINKFFIDEDKIKAQLEENKKKPVKKSKWASKMEEIYKQQQAMQEQQKKK